ncbi:Iron/zinc purple acid phosphatase-like C-terminal domain [Dillenia turbinata]|uniref:Iron/zinc purple acid phosphatase-like C-terminal domain n=1 Tax=Dillenia turbinata TaxID=194707 RepID=A0AAN8WCI1_9MAGN
MSLICRVGHICSLLPIKPIKANHKKWCLRKQEEINTKMEKKWWSHVFVLCILCPHLLFHSQASELEFSRQPPRPLVISPHLGSDEEPQQVHVSLVGKDHMRVSWVTNKTAPSTVEYGRVSGRYEATAKGQHTAYQFFFYKSGQIHHAVIGPLEANTVYYYRCGGSGPEFSFKTPPSTLPLEFVVVGDLGQTEWTKSTLEHVDGMDYDVFLLPGDLSYADGQQPLWDSFGRLVQPYASSRPWMVTEGNHEVESLLSIIPEPFKAYNARWLMPYEQSGSTFERPSPAMSLFREPSFGHGRLRIMNESHALWTWHRNNDSNSVIADQLSLESLTTSKACKQKISISNVKDEF